MNTKDYITAAGYIILLRLLDLGLTFFYTPALRYEWNPVVSVFGYSWLGMLITQILVISFIIFVMSFYFYKNPIIDLPNDLTFKEYIHFYFFDEIRKQKKKWYKPTRYNFRRALAYNGFILMTLAIAVSYLAIINNIMVINKVQSYSMFIIKYGNYFYPSILILLAILSFYAFFIIEYRTYKSKLVQVPND